MPPFVPRKRQHSPVSQSPPSKRNRSNGTRGLQKPTLFDTIDTPAAQKKSAGETRDYLRSLDDNGDDDESSAASDLDSDDFEDVLPAKRSRANGNVSKQVEKENDDDDDEDHEDEEMDWEDAIGDNAAVSSVKSTNVTAPDPEIADISISLNDDGSYVDAITAMAATRKGPSKRERQVRVNTHCLHVQALMWHNTVRNSWANDKQVQKTLIDGLTEGVQREVTRWRHSMGKLSKEELRAKKEQAAAKGRPKTKRSGKVKAESSGRDWSYEAEHLEQGVPDLSRGDPLLRLLKVLTAYWRKRFIATAPGLRKQGYMPLKRLREEIKGWDKDRRDAEQYGERIENLNAFRKLAIRCEGSRDVGALLFVALLRGLGLETRLIANLQPAGLGWSKAEEAPPKRSKKDTTKVNSVSSSPPAPTPTKKSAPKFKQETPTRVSARGIKTDPITLDDTDSPLSDVPSELDGPQDKTDDDISVIDITPIIPSRKVYKKYDRDLAFPNYWAEVCSPVSHKYIPVDPIVLSTIASNDELLLTFEPRGKKAEISKQVICYTIGFSSDGTAKDVTVRYLKKHQLPGKTKGMRVAAEKVPVYNHRGKIKKYEQYDWFRTVMSIYDRPMAKRTAADDLEDQTDLKPFQPAKAEKEVEKESLQWYKQSADYVLEQHLRREEALIPGAEPVKNFIAGKGDKAVSHPVFRRADVVACRTVESWHKEGREIRAGEQPIKHVAQRAVTLQRKREMEEAQRTTGAAPKQGLYARSQTDWIIPPPIVDGVIPRNAFGNIDVYVPTMVPRGAVHLPLRGSAKICRRLGCDYAEACTGFEFGKQRAVPVLTGVVVAEENAARVKEAWREEQKEIKRKEDTKRTAAALHWWRKMLMGLRIVERMRAEYEQVGATEEEFNPFVSKAAREGRGKPTVQVIDGEDEGVDGPGGFFTPGHDEDDFSENRAGRSDKIEEDEDGLGGGFLMDDDVTEKLGDGGFLLEEDNDHKPSTTVGQSSGVHAPTPVSLQSMHKRDIYEPQDASEIEVEVKAVLQKPATAKKKTSKARGAGAVESAKKSRAKKQSKPAREVPDETDLEDLADDSEPSDSDSDRHAPQRSSRARRSVSRASNVKTVPKRPKRSSRKSTPLKSQYFTATSADDDDDDDDTAKPSNDDEESQSDAEIVKPRRTTARTRNKA